MWQKPRLATDNLIVNTRVKNKVQVMKVASARWQRPCKRVAGAACDERRFVPSVHSFTPMNVSRRWRRD
jgi:hypothetical protein